MSSEIGLFIDKNLLSEAYEKHSSNKVGLGESPGLLPDLSTIGCAIIDEAITDAEKLATEIKLSGEVGQLFEKWMVDAKKKQVDCKKTISPIPKNKLSKNLTPFVILAGAIVAGIIASKIFNNEK